MYDVCLTLILEASSPLGVHICVHKRHILHVSCEVNPTGRGFLNTFYALASHADVLRLCVGGYIRLQTDQVGWLSIAHVILLPF